MFANYLSGKPKAGSIYIDCSTVYPDLGDKHEGEAKAAGVAYLTSPVFGRPDAAIARKALVVSAGDPSAKAKVRGLWLSFKLCDQSSAHSAVVLRMQT